MSRVVTLSTGEEVEVPDAPDSMSDADLRAAVESKINSQGKKLAISSGLAQGMQGAAMLVPRALIGTAQAVLPDKAAQWLADNVSLPMEEFVDRQNSKPVKNLMAPRNADGSFQTFDPQINYQTRNATERDLQDVGAAVGSAYMPGASIPRLATNAAANIASQMTAQYAADNNLGDGATTAAAILPNVLLAAGHAALPNATNAAVRAAATAGGKQKLAAAVSQMKEDTTQLPLYPGQAFGTDPHPMTGLMDAAVRDNPAFQAKLADQKALFADAAANAPYKSLYQQASQTPVLPGEANALALALSRVKQKFNLVGDDADAVNQTANLAINQTGQGKKYAPVTNLGQVQNIRDQVGRGDASGVSSAVQAEQRGILNDFLRTKDGRFAAADTAASELLARTQASQLGRDLVGSASLPSGSINSNPGVAALRGVGLNAVLAGAPLVGAAVQASREKQLQRIMMDPTGQALQRAVSGGPLKDLAGDLARAYLQGQLANQVGQ